MNILAVIPARGGSKGIPRKNVIDLAGLPLITYTIYSAKKSKYINRLIVSTEDPEISEISERNGAEVIHRPLKLADDFASTHSVLVQVVEELSKNGYKPDLILTLQPTSPLRTSQHIDEAIELFLKNKDADTLLSCVKVPHNYHPNSLMKKNSEGYIYCANNSIYPLRRQDKEIFYARNGAAIYITPYARIKEYIFGGKIVPYIMSEEESIDIDSMEDLKKAERILEISRSNVSKKT